MSPRPRHPSSEPGSRAAAAGGFTLIELLTVIAIVAILAGVTFGVIRGVKNQSAIARARSELAVLAQALEEYKRQYGDYPQTPTPTTPERFYQALNGKLGPKGATLNARRFIGADQFILDNPDRAKVDDPAQRNPDDAANFLVDPWGNAYRYRYTTDASGRTGYVLFSAGPDGQPIDDTGIPATDPQLADNLYANR